MRMCDTHHKLQQSVSPINIVDNLIHVLNRSLTEFLDHEENIDQQSAKDLGVTVVTTLMKIHSINHTHDKSQSIQVLVCHLQWGEDGGGDYDEKPEVHVKELTDHIGHVGWKDQQEQTQRHCSEVLP